MQTWDPVAEKKRDQRELDSILGKMYREDSSASGISFAEYKKQWKIAQKEKKMKQKYTIFEPMPGESPIDFKKRMKSVVMPIPVETFHEFDERMKKAFNRDTGLFNH